MRRLPLLLLVLLFIPVSFAWWNTDWQYRKNITISESSGTDRINEPVYVEITTSGHANSDCSDYRITDENDNEIPSAVFDCSNGDGTVIFNVNVGSNSQKVYHIYYGNPSATSPSYTYSYSSSSAYVLYSLDDGGFGKFDDCYDSPQVSSSPSFYGNTMRVTDVNGRQLHAGRDGAASNACRSHPFQDSAFAVSDYPVMQIAMKIPPGSTICLFHYMCTSLTSGCSWYVSACTLSGSKGGYAWAPNYFTLQDDDQWHLYTYDISQIGRPYQNTFEFWVSNGAGTHQYYFDQLLFSKGSLSTSLSSEELASICGANGCEAGETYSSCPTDCCESDCTGYSDTTYHSQCDGYGGCSNFIAGCDGKNIGYSYCADSSTYVQCPNVQTSCSSGEYCLNGTGCVACSTVCDGQCQSSACYGVDPDCDSNGQPTMHCCGNSLCEGDYGESCSNCQSDCGVCPASCGDGVCDSDENSCNCPSDCGTCSGDAGRCMSYQCVYGVCQPHYYFHCCGNKVCEEGESFSNCPYDCNPNYIKVDIVKPQTGFIVQRGEQLYIEAYVTFDDGIEGEGAAVVAKGFFGTQEMVENGDGNYSTLVLIPDDIEGGEYELTIVATKGPVGENKTTLVVGEDLYPTIVCPDSLLLSQSLNLSGTVVNEEGEHILTNISIIINDESNRTVLYKRFYNTNSYNYSLQTNLLDREGKWTIIVSARDRYGNSGSVNKTIVVERPPIGTYYVVDLLSPAYSKVKRGDSVEIVAEVSHNEEKVSNCTVYFFDPFGNKVVMNEAGDGTYRYVYHIPDNAPVGDWELTVYAEGDYKGTYYKKIEIEEAELIIEVEGLDKQSYKVGDSMKIRVKATYPDGESVDLDHIDIKVNNDTVRLNNVGSGVYEATYVVQEEGNLNLEVLVLDQYMNQGTESLSVSVEGKSFMYYVRKYPYLFGVAAISIIGSIGYGYYRFSLLNSIEYLKGERSKIMASIKKLQEDYYKKGIISEDLYEDKIVRLESRLKVIESRIKGRRGKKR